MSIVSIIACVHLLGCGVFFLTLTPEEKTYLFFKDSKAYHDKLGWFGRAFVTALCLSLWWLIMPINALQWWRARPK